MKSLNIGSKRRSVQEKKDKYDSKSVVRIVVSLLVAVIAFAGTISFESYLLSDKSIATVVVAKEPITGGTIINEDNRDKYFETVDVNSSLKTKLTYSKVSDIYGKTLTGIEAGQIITENLLSDTAMASEGLKDPVEFTFSISNMQNGVAGTIRAGDICDILILTKGNLGVTESSRTILENVYIIATYDESGTEIASNDTTAKSMTFKIYLDKNDEATFNHLLSENDVTVTKIANYDSKNIVKQVSNFDGLSDEATDTTTDATEQQTSDQTDTSSNTNWVDKSKTTDTETN